MKTLKEYKAELMQNPEFAAAYEELKIEMQSIALDHHSPINLKNDNKRIKSKSQKNKKYLVR